MKEQERDRERERDRDGDRVGNLEGRGGAKAVTERLIRIQVMMIRL